MGELIDREKLLEFAHNHIGGVIDCNDIARFPAVDAEPVRRGRWIGCGRYDEDGYYNIYFICSECGREEPYKEPYCHCGARMEEEGSV